MAAFVSMLPPNPARELYVELHEIIRVPFVLEQYEIAYPPSTATEVRARAAVVRAQLEQYDVRFRHNVNAALTEIYRQLRRGIEERFWVFEGERCDPLDRWADDGGPVR